MPSRWSAVTRILLAAILLLAPACSRRAERLVGNDRLARGENGLGETSRVTLVADRDTWVETGTAVTGPVLLVARTGSYEAVTHFQVAKWNLPDTTDATLSIRSVVLFGISMARDSIDASPAVTIELRRDSTAWTASTIAWPGPVPAEGLLGTATEDFLADTLTVDFTAAAPLDQLKRWAGNPQSLAGLQLALSTSSGEGVAAYRAGSFFIRIAYDRTISGSPVTRTIDTPVTTNLYLHTHASLVPTGSETPLPLGGLDGYGVALHFPTQSIPAGSAIHEVSLLLPVDAATDSIPFDENSRWVNLEVRAAGSDWPETATSSSGLSPSASISGVGPLVAYHGVSDSLLTIRLASSLVRGWSTTPATNNGLLVTSVRGELAQLWISSRESARAPRLRIAFTPPPGQRF